MLRPLRIALSFLTRIPSGVADAQPVDLGRAVGYFPAVGALLGLLAYGAARGLASHLPPTLTALCCVALAAWLTGGLHLDGVSDVFDGLGGARGDRDRALQIMRDSRIGAHGAAALVLVLLGKVLATAELARAGHLLPLLVAPVVARAAAVFAIVGLPYARGEGLGSAMKAHARGSGIAVVVLAAALLGAGLPLSVRGLVALALGLLFALALSRRLRGLTGDCYGAIIELTELALLLLASA